MLPALSLGLLLQEVPAALVSSYTVRFDSLERARVSVEFRPAPAELFMDTSGTGF